MLVYNAVVVDGETGEEQVRKLTATEAAAFEADRESLAAAEAERQAAIAAKESSRQSAIEKLAALGLTEQEAEAVIGA